MAKKYPNISGYRRKPNPEKDGTKNHGKPCINCGVNTIGEKWVQFNFMRGDDETIRVCHKCWKIHDEALISMAIIET